MPSDMLREVWLGLKRFWALRWIIKGPILAFLAFVVLVIIAGVVGGGQEEGEQPEAAAVVQTETATQNTVVATASSGPSLMPEPTRTAEPSPTPRVAPTPTEEARADLTHQVGDARVTPNGWREDPGGQFFKPAGGYKWIVVDLTVENTGDDEYAMSTLLQMQMRDGEGRTYGIAIGPKLQGSLDVVIPVADKVRGEVAFEVPATATGLKFIFKQSFGTKQAMWNLD